jgi:sugar fermentation stimulation protein A
MVAFDNLVSGKLIKRYKRFLADVELEGGEVITAHCPNSGSMLGLQEPESLVYLKYHNSSSRKLQYSWELLEAEGVMVGIHAALANKIAEEALLNGRIKELIPYKSIKREVKYGANSRVDFLLEDNSGQKCYLEVKNVHLKRGDFAEFPDAVSLRAAKHMQDLERVVSEGHRAVVLFVVQRPDCDKFRIAADIDPGYQAAFGQALANGVEALCYKCDVTLSGVWLSDQVIINSRV